MPVEEFNVQQYAMDRASYRNWMERDHLGEEDTSNGTQDTEATEAIARILRFLADGLEHGNMPQRACALLLVIRPDLVNGATYAALASELGVTHETIRRAVKHLREDFPGIQGGYRRTRMTKAQLSLYRQRRTEAVEMHRRVREARIRQAKAAEQLARVAERRLALARQELEREEMKARREAAREMAEFDRRLGIVSATAA